MSGYLIGLVQRARGEGAMLQPRTRGRFEPGGLEVGVAHASSVPPVSLSQTTQTTNINNATTNITNNAVTIEVEPHDAPEPHVTPPPEGRPEARATPELRVESSHLTERVERSAHHDTLREHTQTHSRERELTHHEHTANALREHFASEREHRTHTIAHTRERHTTVHEEQLQNVQITIGRIDVRAVAPQQSQTRHEKSKTPAPLTLDDYLRGKR